MEDELEEYLAQVQMADPEFHAAYEAELKRLRRAWPGYYGRAYGHAYQLRLRARRKRRRR
jgi:hypothetical protein